MRAYTLIIGRGKKQDVPKSGRKVAGRGRSPFPKLTIGHLQVFRYPYGSDILPRMEAFRSCEHWAHLMLVAQERRGKLRNAQQ